MSSHDPSNDRDSIDRRSAVRQKAERVHAAQRRSRILWRSALTVGVVAVVAAGAVGVSMAVGSQASRPDGVPQNVVDDGFAVTSVAGVAAGAPVAGADAATPTPSATASPQGTASTPSPTPSATGPGAVDIRIYVDYYAPGAKQFQVANAPQLSRWVGENAATLSYYPVAMLSAKSNGTKYSQRAAGASACVAANAPDAFYAFNDALLRQQPDQGTDGLTDEQLADLAIASGVDKPTVVRTCIENEEYVNWAKTATQRALEGIPGTKGVALTGTPMILVNGTPYVGALDDPKEFAQFVLTISSDAYYKAASPTPTVTPSAVSTVPSPAPSSSSR